MINTLAEPGKIFFITDENIYQLHPEKFSGKKLIVLPPGEKFKKQSTADDVILRLIEMEADRDSLLVGVGGGVITDLAGYVSSIYLRGIKCGLVPTTILAMVDACIGGKNGVDVGVYKNLVGTIKQPEFLLYDYTFLTTLPKKEWINGFAEIIKHACIRDEDLFIQLENSSLEELIISPLLVASLIKRNVEIKYNIVSRDPLEMGERRLLNFGHTLGHAIENIYHLPHGHAVSIGMIAAAKLSKRLSGFTQSGLEKLSSLLKKYQLPTELKMDIEKVWQILIMDKKRSGNQMKFILLHKIGEGIVKPIGLDELSNLLKELN
jgi:3-dehydroquinate synthase